ncbi:MAG: hypothetical protein JWM49_2439 [Microbacteriaceae bacterium]|nr:hypothetical protein [Microbacteriaceae bacterium]
MTEGDGALGDGALGDGTGGEGTAQPDAARTGRALKSRSLIAAIALSGLTLLAWTGQWYSLRLSEAADGKTVLAVSGSVAAPALVALALAGLALVAALAIAGRFFRTVLGVLQVLIGFTVAFSAILAQSNPVVASASAISAATGVAGRRSIAALVQSVSPTGYPVVAIIAGILTMILGIAVLVTGRRWPSGSDRYRQPVRLATTDPSAPDASDAPGDPVTDWDRLSGGGDPTSR